jgi:O-antigen/teichoic acid export membrane protein
MFKSKFLSNAKADVLFVYLAYSLRYVYLILLIPFYARVLGAEGYGVLLAALSLMQTIWLFVNWGFSTAGTREIAIAKPHEYADIFNIHFSARLVISFAALIIGLIAVYFSNVLSQHLLAGVFAVLLGIISAFNLGWYFGGTGRPRDAVKLEVLGFALNLALILSLVQKEEDSWLAILSIFLSGSFALAVAHWWVRHEIKPVKLKVKEGIALIHASKSIFIFSSVGIVLGASSTYLLSTLSSNTEVGFYGSAERLVSAGLSLMGPVGAVFIPKVMRLLNENVPLAYAYIRKILFFLMAIAITGLLVSELAAELIVKIIFGDQFAGSVDILRCMAIMFPFSAASLILGSYILVPLHQDKLLAKITLWGAVISIVLAIPLTLYYHGFGMAVARVLGTIVSFILLLISCHKLGVLKPLLQK